MRFESAKNAEQVLRLRQNDLDDLDLALTGFLASFDARRRRIRDRLCSSSRDCRCDR
jgi:hypothetical protein